MDLPDQNSKAVHFLVYFSSEPSTDEVELIDDIASDIMLELPYANSYKVETVSSSRPLDLLRKVGEPIFAMFEGY